MGPRANYDCKKCIAARGGEYFKIEDLPVASIRCPLCGAKRGFRRLFDAVNIGNTPMRQLDQAIDPIMTEQLDKHTNRQDGAKRWEKSASEAMERTYHEATPKQRENIKPYKPMVMPASNVMGHLSPQVRTDCREVIYPALTMHKPRPDWVRGPK